MGQIATDGCAFLSRVNRYRHASFTLCPVLRQEDTAPGPWPASNNGPTPPALQRSFVFLHTGALGPSPVLNQLVRINCLKTCAASGRGLNNNTPVPVTQHIHFLKSTHHGTFTCKVVDAFARGLPGVLAVLDCRDEMYNNFAILESNSEENGDILVWFPTTFGERAFKAQTMDTAITPRMSLAFYPDNGSIPPASPWISIQTDLYLPGEGEYKIILHVEQTPRLEYLPRFGSTATDKTARSSEKPPAFSATPPPHWSLRPCSCHHQSRHNQADERTQTAAAIHSLLEVKRKAIARWLAVKDIALRTRRGRGARRKGSKRNLLTAKVS